MLLRIWWRGSEASKEILLRPSCQIWRGSPSWRLCSGCLSPDPIRCHLITKILSRRAERVCLHVHPWHLNE